MTSKTFSQPEMAKTVAALKDPDQIQKHYSIWAPTYDHELDPETYVGPVLAADEVARLVPEDRRAQVRVLDVGAGTGKVGFELKKRGFCHLDALEPCQEMLDILRTKGLYQTTYHEFIGLGQCTIPDGTYDVVMSVGCLGYGSIPISGIDEMIRFVKPGAVVVNVAREEILDAGGFKDKLKLHMDQLEKEGKCKQEAWKHFPRFTGDKPALLFSYRVL